MSYSNTEIAEMVCTRVSHDLIGNIGALSGAMELLKENKNTADADTLNILATATQTLKARQKFFRIAFGLDSKNITPEELQTICDEYLATVGSRSTPLRIAITGASPEIAKIVFLCVMIAAEVCIKDGNITIAVNQQNLTTQVHSEYKLSSGKLETYKKILLGQKLTENVSQYVQLIYLRELLGKEVPMSLSSNENNMQLIIG